MLGDRVVALSNVSGVVRKGEFGVVVGVLEDVGDYAIAVEFDEYNIDKHGLGRIIGSPKCKMGHGFYCRKEDLGIVIPYK